MNVLSEIHLECCPNISQHFVCIYEPEQLIFNRQSGICHMEICGLRLSELWNHKLIPYLVHSMFRIENSLFIFIRFVKIRSKGWPRFLACEQNLVPIEKLTVRCLSKGLYWMRWAHSILFVGYGSSVSFIPKTHSCPQICFSSLPTAWQGWAVFIMRNNIHNSWMLIW